MNQAKLLEARVIASKKMVRSLTFLKRFFFFIGGVVALAALAFFVLNGTAENLFHTVLDYLM